MSDPATSAPKPAEKERLQLPPLPPGWVRGRAIAVATSTEDTPAGMRTTQRITLQQPKPEPPLLVSLSGLRISRLVREGQFIQVFRGDSTEQPLPVTRVNLPVKDHWIEASDDPPLAADAAPPTAPPAEPPAEPSVERPTEPKVAAADRIKLPPVPKGWVRGRVADVVFSTEETVLGARAVHTITLQPPKPAPPLVVRLSGLIITRRVREGDLIQVFRGDRTEQPLIVDRIGLPINDRWIEAYDGPKPRPPSGLRARLGTLAMLAAPIVAVLVVLWLCWFYWRIYR